MDLIVMAADKDAGAAIGAILQRPEALGIRSGIAWRIVVNPRHDPGVLQRAHIELDPYVNQFAYALAVFDRQGCGREECPRNVLEEAVEKRLTECGWRGRSAAVAIDPELEAWVWSDSPHVTHALGWKTAQPDVRAWLRTERFVIGDNGKPLRPKEAVERVLYFVRKPRSSALYAGLARNVSFERCADPAFGKLKSTLQAWFPAEAK